MTTPKQHYALVEVIWEDCAGMDAGWTKVTKVTPVLIRSAGYLVLCDRSHVVIATDTCGEGEHNGRTQIPRGMVKKLKILRRADGR